MPYRCAPLLTGALLAQAQAPVTMKQLMLDLIHPAANDILLSINRGGPQNDAEWATARRAAITVASDPLSARGPRNQEDWAKSAKMLSDAGMAAYKAAQAKDAKALAAVAQSIDQSCTACHQQFRPNVFPRPASEKGGSQ